MASRKFGSLNAPFSLKKITFPFFLGREGLTFLLLFFLLLLEGWHLCCNYDGEQSITGKKSSVFDRLGAGSSDSDSGASPMAKVIVTGLGKLSTGSSSADVSFVAV